MDEVGGRIEALADGVGLEPTLLSEMFGSLSGFSRSAWVGVGQVRKWAENGAR